MIGNGLVVVMSDSSYLLMSYPDGDLAALAIAEDAGPLRQVLTMVFRSMQ
ncbi:MAG: hypothetical protein M3R63_21840 [Actinomycetota bacterium]|nr:hypothetical protein [Actinomycetota bacterium]